MKQPIAIVNGEEVAICSMDWYSDGEISHFCAILDGELKTLFKPDSTNGYWHEHTKKSYQVEFKEGAKCN